MTDELDRIRDLAGEVPGPDVSWVTATRADLLARADREAADVPGATPANRPSLWCRLLAALRAVTRRPAITLAAVAVVLIVVVGGWAVTRGADTGTDTRPDTARLAATCSSPDGAYTVAYPAGWHANTGETMPACHVFDPAPIRLDEGVGGGPFGAVTIRKVPPGLDVVRDPGPAADVVSDTETSVAGRTAVRQLVEHAGDAALPEGTRSYRYLIDLDGPTLLAEVYDTGAPPFSEKREILDEMMRTLRLHD